VRVHVAAHAGGGNDLDLARCKHLSLLHARTILRTHARTHT
jgi:hypothetical protein